MFTKQDCFNILSEINERIGFIFPEENLRYSVKQMPNTASSFVPVDNIISMTVGNNISDSNEHINGCTTYNISHELGHAVLDFVIKNNITSENVNTLTLLKYNNLLSQYYNKNIELSEKHLENFKVFVSNPPWFSEKVRDVIVFDDKYYATDGVLSYLEYGNLSLELFANDFAVHQTIQQIEFETNRYSEEFLQGMAQAGFFATSYIDLNELEKNKDLFNKQIKDAYTTINIIKKLLKNDYTVKPKFKNYDFKKFALTIKPVIENLKSNILKFTEKHPTKERLEEMEKEKKRVLQEKTEAINRIKNIKNNQVNIYFENSFELMNCDKDNCIIIDSTKEFGSLATKTEIHASFETTRAIVVDLENKTFYVFDKEPVKKLNSEIADAVICNTNIEIPPTIDEENQINF
jgi:hypothetical protein